MSKNYTAADFANARFAEHPDGRLAHRINHPDGWSWAIEDLNGNRDRAKENYMIRRGWVPVPTKPTITESVVKAETANMNAGDKAIFGLALYVAGVEVTPDPEPTNTDRLERLIRESGLTISDNGIEGCAAELAASLNEDGVTAPKEDR